MVTQPLLKIINDPTDKSYPVSASPQLEDGFTQIANELLEAIYNINLSSYESRILQFIIRMTYGFKKKADSISISQFEHGVIDKKAHTVTIRGTNIPHNKICSTLTKLESRNIITRRKDSYITEYSIQKDYTRWIDPIVSDQIGSDHSVSDQPVTTPVTNQSLPSDQIVTETSDHSVTHKINKRNITKEIIPNKGKQKEIFEEFLLNLKKDKRYETLEIDHEWEKCQRHWSEGKKRMERPKSAFTNWLDKALEIQADRKSKQGPASFARPGVPGNRPAGAFDEYENINEESINALEGK